MTDPDTIITTMAQQREQERAQDEAHYKLRKACRERAEELYWLLVRSGGAIRGLGPRVRLPISDDIDQLLKEIDDASH